MFCCGLCHKFPTTFFGENPFFSLRIIAVGRPTVQDMTRSRDLLVLRQFRDVIPSTVKSLGDRMTSSPATDQSESLLRPRQVTCADLLMTSRGSSLLATGCSNGDVIVWDVSVCEPYKVYAVIVLINIFITFYCIIVKKTSVLLICR